MGKVTGHFATMLALPPTLCRYFRIRLKMREVTSLAA